ncbi:hypothetical protein AB3S75_012496 [Citrus x aurantiifolia]
MDEYPKNMLKGSPDVYLSGPIRKYITEKGGRFHLRWGCREMHYDKSANGETFVKGLAMSKVHKEDPTVKYDGGTLVKNEVSRDVREKSRESETDRASSSFV